MRWSPVFAELARQTWIGEFDELVRSAHGPRVAGVDEVGRGCLAGPVVVAAVVLGPNASMPGIDDSKHMTPEQRVRAASGIRGKAIDWCVRACEPRRIDSINILEATREAALSALRGLDQPLDAVITDALTLAGSGSPVVPVVRGDSLSLSVAAASVLAKVERDERMRQLDRDFPHYRFSEHKGYASATHLEALRRFGPCPAHRLTFASVVPREVAGEPS